MKKSIFTEAQIVSILNEYEAGKRQLIFVSYNK